MDAKRRFGGWTRVSMLVGLLVAACSGNDGAAGKDGANGANGADGKDGANGEAGPAGAVGPAGDAGPAGEAGPTKAPRLLDSKIGGWVDKNRSAINQMIEDYGIASSGFDATRRPVAVFDWDNTVIKNDIGDGTFAWMVAHDKVLQPPGKDWGQTSPHLTADAKSALNAACDAAANAGDPLPTSSTAACAAEIMNVYYNGETVGAKAAWSPDETTMMNTAYAWAAQLQAGYSPSEIRSFATQAFEQNEGATLSSKQTVGSVELAGYIRVYDQIRDLSETLTANGFDVWIVSASPQFVVEALSDEVGVDPSNVIGIRTMVVDGKSTYDLQGCGSVGDAQNTLITFDRGKRCWINKVIFGEPASTQLDSNADTTKRPTFVAGDSDTDIAMLKDATVLKLVIERNKPQVMCNALANYQSKWLVQPMFIDPKTKPSTPYDCPNYTDPDGNPIVDEAGKPFPTPLGP